MTIDELARLAGEDVSPRTIRYYIAEGLLPGPGARGRLASYGEAHLSRLRLIRRLIGQGMRLPEVRERLRGMSDEDVRALLADEEARETRLRVAELVSPRAYVAELLRRARERRLGEAAGAGPARPPLAEPPAPAGNSPQAAWTRCEANAWLRWELAPGVEVHVRGEVYRRRRRQLDRWLREAEERLRSEG